MDHVLVQQKNLGVVRTRSSSRPLELHDTPAKQAQAQAQAHTRHACTGTGTGGGFASTADTQCLEELLSAKEALWRHQGGDACTGTHE